MITTTLSASDEKSATFILFNTKEKLTITELKRAFRVKKGRLLSIKGKNCQVVNLFDQLNAIKNSISRDGKYFNFEGNKLTTHIYIVA